MSENRNQDMGRGSEGLGNQSQSSDMEQSGMQQGPQENLGRSSVADYGSSGQPLDSGDSGRGGSTGTGRTDTGGLDDMDAEGLGHSRNGAGGM